MSQSKQSRKDSASAGVSIQSAQMSIDTILNSPSISQTSRTTRNSTTRSSSTSDISKLKKDSKQGRNKNKSNNKQGKQKQGLELPPNDQSGTPIESNYSQQFTLGPRWIPPSLPDGSQAGASKIIPDEKRGDLGAISDALNMVYSSLEIGQANFKAYIDLSESKFETIEKEVCTLHNRMDSLSDKLENQKKDYDQLEHQFVSSERLDE